MEKNCSVTRRRFLGGTLGAGAALTPLFHIVPRSVLGGPGHTPPSEKLRIACVGCGGKGNVDVKGVSTEVLVAFCDVDDKRAAQTFKAHPEVPRYKDFREMLDKEEKNIDAVTVTVPDHMHAPIALRAMAMGKHVFVQKPLTHTVEEARLMQEAARKHKLATQMGIQGHSSEGIRLYREWIEAGAIGTVKEIHIWTNRPIWPQGLDRPEQEDPIPETLDWDLWLGVAPTRPFYAGYVPFKWRGWFDFGTGALGDMGCHQLDAAFWTFDLGMPKRVELVGMDASYTETYPKWSILRFHFPAKGKRPAVALTWYDGKKLPPRPDELDPKRKMGDGGQLIYGTDGILFTGGSASSPRLIPETKMQEFLATKPEKKYPRVKDHYQDWIEACKGGRAAGANFNYAGPLTQTVLLGNVALRVGRTIEWDAKKRQVTNVPEANQLLRTEYREEFAL